MKHRSKKHVTWSPVVVSYNRPENHRNILTWTKSKFALLMGSNSQKVVGKILAHFRKNTHSLLLTIRNDTHRDIQLLIDLPNQQIKRIYDGKNTWNIAKENGKDMSLKVKLGTIHWRDDDEIRDCDARGFRLGWLNGMHNISVQSSTQKNSRKKFRSCSRRKRKKSSCRRKRTGR